MTSEPSPVPRGQEKQILILAGEPSGDVHGGHLAAAIRKSSPHSRMTGIGGPNMEAAGVDLFYDIDQLSAMGVVEILGQFRQIRDAFRKFTRKMKQLDPDLVILIDYPGFNLRAAAWVKAHSRARVMYYITPKVWAWNQRRLNKIKAHVDHAALIFPFEIPLYKKFDIPATFVGTPLMDRYPHEPYPASAESGNELTLGILPGSRKAEVESLLGVMLDSASLLKQKFPKLRILISSAQSVQGRLGERFNEIIDSHDLASHVQVVKGHPDRIFNQADLLVAASGTVTLEAALCTVPTILVYRMSPLTYKLAKLLVKVEYAGLANLVAGQPVMPELLQDEASPQRIFDTALEMLQDLNYHRRQLSLIRKRLGPPGCSRRAARIALELAGSPP